MPMLVQWTIFTCLPEGGNQSDFATVCPRFVVTLTPPPPIYCFSPSFHKVMSAISVYCHLWFLFISAIIGPKKLLPFLRKHPLYMFLDLQWVSTNICGYLMPDSIVPFYPSSIWKWTSACVAHPDPLVAIKRLYSGTGAKAYIIYQTGDTFSKKPV